MEKITYIGLERCDFLYHLANILSLQGSVLVIDKSKSLDLIKSVSKSEDLDEPVEWRNIVYAKDIDEEKTDISDFDYILIYAGLNFEEKDFYENALTLIMPDFTSLTLKPLSGSIPVNVTNPMIILRDYCTKKFNQKSVAAYLSVNPKDITGYISINKEDFSSYVSLTHNHYSNIKSVSEEMLEGLEFVSAKVLGISDDTRKINKVIKAATKIK